MINSSPPKAKKTPKTLELHNDKRIDNYFWMNERDSKEVLEYLEAENAYNEAIALPRKSLQKQLFQEMKSRIKENDSSVPYYHNGYWYVTCYEKDKDYPIYKRRKKHIDAPDQVLFDCNEMAKEHSFFVLGGYAISPNNRYVVYNTDTVGRRIYTTRIKDLNTGKLLPDIIDYTTSNVVWANDNNTFFYSRQDKITLRSDKIFKYCIDGIKKEQLVFHEKDETYNVFVDKTKTNKYIIINSYSTLTTEQQILEANQPTSTFKVVQPRIKGLEYTLHHFNSDFYIITNADKSPNFKIVKTPENKTTKDYWEEVLSHRKDTLIEDVDIFKDYLVISERYKGLNKIRVTKWRTGETYYIPFNSETYTAYTSSTNLEFDTPKLRFLYSSLTTPSTVIDFDMTTKKKVVKKETEILGGGFDKSNYLSERIWTIANDGVKIPMSLVYKKGLNKNGDNPTLIYAYGAYGHTIDPYFSSTRLSLLDRGFIMVIAHVRGGEYMGRSWYEKGKLLHKKNTFTDFIACTKYLIQERYTSPKKCYASGGSAGGLLMGAVANMAPEFYNGIILNVPFLDLITTMLDKNLPLTTGEYDEWGNPNEETYYHYMKSYSPYDNIKIQGYPNMLVLTGYHDSQVQYWEPAKWVAKLRELKTDHNLLLFKINMNAGHSGASGRFEALREVAEEYRFLLTLEGF